MKIDKGTASKEDFLKAVKDGVCLAILTMTESGDGKSGIIIREPFLDAVRQGVYEAIVQMIPLPKEVEDHLREFLGKN